MAKFSSRDLLEVLRGFGVAGDLDVPRQIERIEVSHPSPINTLFSFLFNKTMFFVLQDETAEDDLEYITEQIRLIQTHASGEVVRNPHDTLTTYALPFKGKEIYLFQTKRLGKRLDTYLAERYPEFSRSTWQKYVKSGAVTVNGTVIDSPKHDVKPTDTVTAKPPEKTATDGELPIIYEDKHVVVVNKPIGVLTHSKGALNDEFTVAEFIRPKTDVATDSDRPGIVHRLDRDTSGVIIAAKTEVSANTLRRQFADRKAKKTYLAVVEKAPQQPEGLIDVPIARNPKSPSTFRADPNGKSAQTRYKTLQVNTDTGHGLVELQPRTGRTHQLRVHMAYIGTPIVGDRVYGTAGDRLMLHAWQLEVSLPGGDRQTFVAPVPSDFSTSFDHIDRHAS